MKWAEYCVTCDDLSCFDLVVKVRKDLGLPTPTIGPIRWQSDELASQAIANQRNNAAALGWHKRDHLFTHPGNPGDGDVIFMGDRLRGLYHCGVMLSMGVLHTVKNQPAQWNNLALLSTRYEYVERWTLKSLESPTNESRLGQPKPRLKT